MKLTTKGGLLYIDGKLVDLPYANTYARSIGFLYVERLVKALEQLKPWQLLCPECGTVVDEGGSGQRQRCRECSAARHRAQMRQWHKDNNFNGGAA